MATMVKGEDGRVIEEKIGDLDALDMARRVHANTGEVVSLTPYVLKKGEYVLEHEAERLFGKSEAVVEAAVEAGDLEALSVKELKALAAERGVALPEKAKKAEIVAALKAA